MWAAHLTDANGVDCVALEGMCCKLTADPPKSGTTVAARRNRSKRASNQSDDRIPKKSRAEPSVVTTSDADNTDADNTDAGNTADAGNTDDTGNTDANADTTSDADADNTARAGASTTSTTTSSLHGQCQEPYTSHDEIDVGSDDPFEGVGPDSADGEGKWYCSICARYFNFTDVGDTPSNISEVARSKPVSATAAAATGVHACGGTCMLAAPGVKPSHKNEVAGKTAVLQVVRKRFTPAPYHSLRV